MKKTNASVAINNAGTTVGRVGKKFANGTAKAVKTVAKVTASAMLFEAGGLACRAVRKDIVDTTKLIHDEIKNVPVAKEGMFGKTKYVDRHTGKKVRGYKPQPLVPEVIPNQKEVLELAGALTDAAAGVATTCVMSPMVHNAIDNIGCNNSVNVAVAIEEEDFDDECMDII